MKWDENKTTMPVLEILVLLSIHMHILNSFLVFSLTIPSKWMCVHILHNVSQTDVLLLFSSKNMSRNATFRLTWDTQNLMTPKSFPDQEGVADGHPRPCRSCISFTRPIFLVLLHVNIS
jgi:hypothetical protein